MSDTTIRLPSAPEALPPLEPVMHDQAGRLYIPLLPKDRHMSVPLDPRDLLILRDGYLERARRALQAGNHQEWAGCQKRANEFLAVAQSLDPVLHQITGAETSDALV